MMGSKIVRALLAVVAVASTAACGPTEACKCSDARVNASIWGTDDGTLFVAGYTGLDGGFVKTSTESGFSERDLFEFPLWHGWGSTATDYFVVGGSVGNASVAHRSGDQIQVYGASGRAAPVNSAWGIWGAAADSVFVVGSGGSIAHFDGSTWTAQQSSVMDDLRDVWGSSADDVFAVGRNGALVHFDGATWTRLTSPTDADLNAIWGSSPSDVFVVGETEAEQAHVILHYDGESFSVVHQGERGLLGIHGAGPDRVIAVGGKRNDSGIEAAILKFDGSEWSEVASSVKTFVWDVWVAEDGASYTLVGPNDTLLSQAF